MSNSSTAEPGRLPSATCIVTCFNYGRFLAEALRSARSQSHRFDEIIVVDDASTDDTEAVAAQCAADDPSIRVIRHATNRGQLAAFESGILAASGEILFFLDADDLLSPDYVATVLDVYRGSPACDFTFCRCRNFEGVPPVLRAATTPASADDLGLTVVRTLMKEVFIGAPTSCISMQRRLALRLVPLPLYEEWRTRADDCLVFGASLAGGRKFRIRQELVAYRVHGANAFATNQTMGEPAEFLKRQIRVQQLFQRLREKLDLSPDVMRLAHLEFKTRSGRTAGEALEYIGFVLRHGALHVGRIRGLLVILKWYLVGR